MLDCVSLIDHDQIWVQLHRTLNTPMNNKMDKPHLPRARHNHVRNATMPLGDPHIKTFLISGLVEAGTDYRDI